METWFEGMENPALNTPAAQELLGKYTSQEEFNIGHVNAQESIGVPFKLPESMDKLKDDAVRADLTSKIGALLGKDVSSIATKEELEEVNYAEGLSDARMLHPDLKKEIAKWATDGKHSKAEAKSVALMVNKFIMGFVNTQDTDRTTKSTEVHEALKPLFGGEDGVKKSQENVHRMFLNHAGLTVDEYGDAVKAIIDAGMNQDVAISKALFNLAKLIVPEGITETPQAGIKPTEKAEGTGGMESTGEVLGWSKK